MCCALYSGSPQMSLSVTSYTTLARVATKRYVGDWMAAKKHGQGELYYANGDMFRGEWKQERGLKSTSVAHAATFDTLRSDRRVPSLLGASMDRIEHAAMVFSYMRTITGMRASGKTIVDMGMAHSTTRMARGQNRVGQSMAHTIHVSMGIGGHEVP